MLIDDIIYLVVLLVCVGFGEVFRRIKEPITKQWVSTCFGILVSYIVSGVNVIHPILCTIITAFLVVNLSQRTRHIVAFFFSFFYLLVIFRLSELRGEQEPPGHINLIQMILTLRLSGIGFEINSAVESLQNDPDNKTYKSMKNIKFFDVFHYGMSYIGLLTGPYYTYRTYWDSIHKNFSDYADIKGNTIKKLKLIGISSVVHLFFSLYYPISYVYTNEFQARSLFYRFFYVYPSFFTFKTRIYTGMMLSEAVCEMAGLGAYPASCEPKSGLGPSNYKKAIELAENPKELVNQEINFETVHNIDIPEVEASYKVRRAMKTWNITVQYWMAAYVYKQFPSKALRTAATFMTSALWHGYAFGYYVTLLSLIFFLPVEDLYVKFYKKSPEDSLVRGGLWALLYFLRFSCMSYLGIGFQLLSYKNTVYYFGNIYAAGHLFTALLFIIGKLGEPYFLGKSDKQQ